MGKDERTYGFSKEDADELIDLIGSGESTFPEIRPRGGGGGSGAIFGFTLTAEKTQIADSVAAEIYNLNGAAFGTLVETSTLYDPANWYGPASIGSVGICRLQGGKYYALQAACLAEYL